MEDVKSDNSKTMEEVQESSSWGEWTIIHDDKENNHVTPVPIVPEEKPEDVSEGDDTKGECPIVEEAREVIEEINPSTLDENSVVPSVSCDEDSDGISAITESDKGEGETKGEVSRVIEGFEETIPRIGPYANFIAACCLAAAIGFGIGCVVGTGNTELPSSDVQVTPETSFRPIKNPKSDVSEDFSITIDSEPFIPSPNHPKVINKDHTRQEKRQDMLENSLNLNDQNLNIKNFEKIPNYKNSLQKLKLSLDTLCSLLDENQRSNYENICRRNSRIFQVIELENTVKYIVNEFGYNEDVSMKKFIESIDSKIGNIVTLFLDRLSKIFDKMRSKLHNKICLIRNTYNDGKKIQKILDQRSISLENCENKSSVKIPKAKKKKKFDKKEINSISKSISGEESSEIQNPEIPESKNTRNKGNKNDKSEDFRKKKQYSSNKEASRDDLNEKNISKKYKSNHQDSNEQIDFTSSENAKNKRENYSKSKKKYKKIRESNGNSSEESVFNSFEDQKENKKENRNDLKSSKKYGTPKGEPKENFVEKKHGNDYEANEHRNENICQSKKCSKTSDFEEKNYRKDNGKNGHWQFERAREREKYRFDEDNLHDVWYNDRARARERARRGF